MNINSVPKDGREIQSMPSLYQKFVEDKIHSEEESSLKKTGQLNY